MLKDKFKFDNFENIKSSTFNLKTKNILILKKIVFKYL
ncbi:hypothetical protein RIEPE_0512 [Candidatus Riesia pediculicola USDA]|uniref:Uncharacterized protein n=1 Tax=Riesia pediculicola (strain USDA) TaxID=515618 RepID=D4G8U0_RIEPU|nr:hypothetical protein RIEPE_0512 [Candidatus Riesia pediculicola USDA]